MHRLDLRHTIIVALYLFLATFAGCGPPIPAPEPPPLATEVSETAGPEASPPKTFSISVIWPDAKHLPAEVNIWEQTLRHEATRTKTIIEVEQPEPNAPPKSQADLIGKATARGVSGMLVIPGPDREVAEALAKARDQGVPVVLLDRGAPVPGKPLPLVTFGGEREATDKLVAEALKFAKRAELPNGPAVIVYHDIGNPRGEERMAMLEAALKEAKVEVLPRITYVGVYTQIDSLMKPILAAHPRLPLAFASDDDAFSGLGETLNNISGTDRFILAGYGQEARSRNQLTYGQSSVRVDLNTTGLAHLGFQTLMDLIQGKTIPDKVEARLTIQSAQPASETSIRMPRGRPRVP